MFFQGQKLCDLAMGQDSTCLSTTLQHLERSVDGLGLSRIHPHPYSISSLSPFAALKGACLAIMRLGKMQLSPRTRLYSPEIMAFMKVCAGHVATLLPT